MSTCERCGAQFHCAMADATPDKTPCWCTFLPPAMPVPSADPVGCWCPECLRAHIATLETPHAPQR